MSNPPKVDGNKRDISRHLLTTSLGHSHIYGTCFTNFQEGGWNNIVPRTVNSVYG